MGSDTIDLDDQMKVVAERVEFIDLLNDEGPLEPRDIVAALDYSRSTVTRVLRALREADLIEKTTDGYVATLPGIMAADEYRRYETASEAILISKEVLAPIPEPHAPPADLLIEADTIRAEGAIPVRPLEAVSDRVRDADTVRAYLPTLVNTHLLRVWHWAVVVQNVESEAIFEPDLLTVLKGQYPQLLAEMATTEGFGAFATSGPPYGVVLTTTDDTTTVSVIVYEDDTAVRGVVINDSEAAVEWARNEFARLKDIATEVTADLDALSAAVADGMPDLSPAGSGQQSLGRHDRTVDAAGHPLPLDLETEGFVRLSPEYFDTHRQVSPDVSWRTGFTLADVYAGHAVDRLDDEGQNLTDALVEKLRGGTDHVVLGPPGAGKSTICMAVACAWYERGLGPVLYRERGGGDHFTAAAVLEAYLRQPDDHALVVVEDAVREQATAIFEVMQALNDDPTVTFLLDARTQEWRNTDMFALDARLDTYRRTATEQVSVPTMDDQECGRFVAHFADLVDADLAISGSELFARLEAGTTTAGENEVPAGRALIAQHHLTRRYEPAVAGDAAAPTALDEAVRHTYQQLADAEAPFALDLAVLISLLTAAGVPVAGEYLYAIAEADDYTALDEAIALLEGHLVFDPARPQRDSPTTYRTRHETWALRFLEAVRDCEPAQRARERFGHCVTQVVALADESDQRQQIKQHLGGRTPHLHQIEADPEHWADEIVERIFGIGRTNASLAPLFGETTGDTIELPDACSAWTKVQQAYWRGEMNRLYGNLERAGREFHTLRERAETVEIADDHVLKPAITVGTSSDDGSDERKIEEPEIQRKHWRATSLTKRGRVADMSGEWEVAVESHEKSLVLFREIDDRHGEAKALHNLGRVARKRGDLERAAEYYEESLALYREIGDRRGKAEALHDLGRVAKNRGETEAAAEHNQEGLSLFREIGDRHGEAKTLNDLGKVARIRGDLEAATEHHEESLAVFREIGARRDETEALYNLGVVARRRGELESAKEYFEESLSLFREISDRHDEALTLLNLGLVARKRGELENAADYFEESLALYREIGNPRGEIGALINRGMVANDRGWLEVATEYVEESLALCREIGARQYEALVLTNLGRVARTRGELEAAAGYHEESLALYRKSDDRRGEAAALNDLGVVAHKRGDLERAVEYFEESLAIFHEVGFRENEADVLDNLGVVARKRGELEAATEYHEESLAVFREIGARRDEAEALHNLGVVARKQGELERARARFAEAAEVFVTIGAREAATALRDVVDVCEQQGDIDAARDWCQRAIDFAEQTDRKELHEEFSARRLDLADNDNAPAETPRKRRQSTTEESGSPDKQY